MDLDLFLDVLRINSTSGSERPLAEFLCQRLKDEGCEIERIPADAAEGQPVNLWVKWGKPVVAFCTHLDTVPPYIPPTVEETPEGIVIRGRGACDAKGQIISMLQACLELHRQGCEGFSLLLLYGEETGSFGAKMMTGYPGAEYVVVGEPTDNCMAQASKGTKAFQIEIAGKSFHSGYPQYGDSAVETFVDLMNRIRAEKFPIDPELGATTYNVGKLVSDNPQNILSPKLSCRVYFRTTFASDQYVCRFMESLASERVKVEALGGDTPSHYLTLPGFPVTTVAFGSDAPQLRNFPKKMLCGPGSILVAHTSDEYINVSDIERATQNYISIFHTLTSK